MSGPPDNSPNPSHASAAGAYDRRAQTNTGSRDIEARALLKAAKQLQDLQEHWQENPPDTLEDVLNQNRQIWLMFVDTAVEHENTGQGHTDGSPLQDDIASLGLFIFRHTLDILAAPEKEKLSILIDINRDIATGLMGKTVSYTSPLSENDKNHR